MIYIEPKFACKLETLYKLVEHQYPVIKVGGSLKTKILIEVQKAHEKYKNDCNKGVAVSTLTLLGVLSMNPTIMLGTNLAALSYNNSIRKEGFLSEYQYSYFEKKGEMILLLFHSSYDAGINGVKGYEKYFFHRHYKKIECLCGCEIKDDFYEDPHTRYTCTCCGRRLIRRY